MRFDNLRLVFPNMTKHYNWQKDAHSRGFFFFLKESSSGWVPAIDIRFE